MGGAEKGCREGGQDLRRRRADYGRRERTSVAGLIRARDSFVYSLRCRLVWAGRCFLPGYEGGGLTHFL